MLTSCVFIDKFINLCEGCPLSVLTGDNSSTNCTLEPCLGDAQQLEPSLTLSSQSLQTLLYIWDWDHGENGYSEKSKHLLKVTQHSVGRSGTGPQTRDSHLALGFSTDAFCQNTHTHSISQAWLPHCVAFNESGKSTPC